MAERKMTNGFDGEKLRGYLEKLESFQADIESAKAEHMRRCQSIKGSMQVVYDEADALGIPRKVLKAHLTLRNLERKKGAVVDKLNEGDAEAFDLAADALGDFAVLPLFRNAQDDRAAADRAALADMAG